MKNRSRIRKAIILAGEADAQLSPLTRYHSLWMLPVLNKPLIRHTIEFLKLNGITEAAFALRSNGDISSELLNEKDIDFYCHIEDRHRGSAGTIKDMESFIGGDTVFVINGNLFLGGIDLDVLARKHFKGNSLFTIGLLRKGISSGNEKIVFDADGRISSFLSDYSPAGLSQWQSAGIFILSPEVLKFIDEKKYMDIMEQLIPQLLKESANVFAEEIRGYHRALNSVNDYISIHREVLLREDYADYLAGYKEIAHGIWVIGDVDISQDAYMVGPAVLGDGCVVGNNAQIIGPVVLGNRCQVSADALVRESVLWDSTVLSEKARVEFSILGECSDVRSNYHIRNMIVMNGFRKEDANLITSDYSIMTAVDLSGMISSVFVKKVFYNIFKRTIDIALSLIGIFFLSPLFIIIALAIKLDSAGQVLYVQKRCGIKGKLFGMIKFRTMVADAEKMHGGLISKNELDGPIFKIADDPRVTRCGELLRKTSLDELPQLFNVLKGEMSLVGPRPLITDEMRFSPTWRDTRLKVKPGITGLWQVEGRSDTPFHDWIKYDMYYVTNRSFMLDMKILFKTIKVVLKKAGAY